GLNEENLSLEESPKRKPSARPYDPGRKKSTSPGTSRTSRSTEAPGSRAANGQQRRTGPKSNPAGTNGGPPQAEGVNGSAEAGAHVNTSEAPGTVPEADDTAQHTPAPAAPPFDPDAT